MPSNDLTPRKFADIVADTLKGDHILIESLNKWALEKRHMGGIVAVGKGSMNPPQLVSIAYQGDPNSREVLGIVGKGVTYDSGGLSLKSHKGLEFMKDDMAGAQLPSASSGPHAPALSGQCAGRLAPGGKYSFRHGLSRRRYFDHV